MKTKNNERKFTERVRVNVMLMLLIMIRKGVGVKRTVVNSFESSY